MQTWISDLDSTLVYLHPGEECEIVQVEEINETKSTYMTKKAKALFEDLFKRKDFTFVPCSIRNKNLIERIGFLREYRPQYMICDNGATIYINGEKDESYERYLTETGIINPKDMMHFREMLNEILPSDMNFYDHGNYFIEFVFKAKDVADIYVPIIKEKIQDSDYILRLEKHKFYIIPKKLGKEVAVQYLMKRYNLGRIITSGDTFADEKFVKLGDAAILPGHADFHVKNEIRTDRSGILAGEEILERIYYGKQ